MLRQWALMNHEKNHRSKGFVLVPSVEFSLVRIVKNSCYTMHQGGLVVYSQADSTPRWLWSTYYDH